MARTRSPNYPYIGLATALERVRKIYEEDHRNRMSREVVAEHLGYGSLNGISLSVISALGKYGLLETIDSDLQVSEDAVTILVDPPDSPDRAQAIRRAALKPDLFAELYKRFGGQVPSDANLLAHLQKTGFTANAAAQVAKSFRETMALVSQQANGHNSSDRISQPEERMQSLTQQERPKVPTPPPTSATEPRPQVAEPGERELVNIKLSTDGRARILISGPTTPKEIDKLIRVLHLQRELLADEPQPVDLSEAANLAASDLASPNTASDPASPDKGAQVSFFITKSQKIQLRERGYSDDAIANMKPAEAHQILGLQ